MAEKTLSADDVRHVAKLARLHLSEQEVEKFTGQLGTIVADERRAAKALDAARTAVQAATRRR